MPPANQDQLNQQLDNLLTLSKEEVLVFFKANLDGLDAKKVVGNLKMLMMFMDAVAAEELKKRILNNLSKKSRNIALITQYLQTRAFDEMMAQIPVKESKGDHFDFEDAKDVDQFHKVGAKYQWHNFDQELRKVISVLPYKTQTELEKEHLLKSRLENIIITYLKDVRDELETRQRLSASKQLGGMGFDYDLVNNIFQVLQIKPVEAKAPQIKIEPVKKESKLKAIKEQELEPNKEQSFMELQKPKLKVPQPPPAAPVGTVIPINQHKITQPIDTQRIVRINRISSKNIISDIKHPQARSISPAEELSALTLEDLRRDEPEKFIKNILIKIDALTRENYIYRMQAIGAWKRSPLYKQYMEIGQASLNQGCSVREYLSGGDSKNQLTYADFEAIGAINQKLRF